MPKLTTEELHLLATILICWDVEEPEARLLLEWLGYEPALATQQKLYGWYSSDRGPDICLTCHSYYGNTYSGRLRYGCPFCQTHPFDASLDRKDRALMIDRLWPVYSGRMLDLTFARLLLKLSPNVTYRSAF